MRMIMKLMLRLLPAQVILAAVGAVNGIVSSYFAGNYVGVDAMSAIGLYSPVNQLLGAISTMLTGGCAIICGACLGRNDRRRLGGIFSLDLALSLAIAAVFSAVLAVIGLFGLGGIFTKSALLRPILERYLIGQAIGIIPLYIGNQLAVFLALENRARRTFTASLVYIAANVALNLLFVQVMRMGELGLALASSLGMWIFMAVELQYFLSPKAQLKPSFRDLDLKEISGILVVGFPGALSYLYQTIRGFIVNGLLEAHTGSMGLSAFAAANNVMNLFWAIPVGMLAVSRLLISVSVGEEDRRTLADVMRVMMRCFLPMMLAVDLCLIAASEPLSSLFFSDRSIPAFGMMALGLRILPLCMPFSIIAMHFTVYAQSMKNMRFVHVIALLDGVVCVAGFSALLIGAMGIAAVYVANVLNGIVCLLYIICYAWKAGGRFPRCMEDLLAMPEGFGVPEEDRIDISVRSMEEVSSVSERIQAFCLEKGIDERRSFLAALAMEEAAGNVVDHGFRKDSKQHSVDVRAVYKDDGLILRIKDDCVPFDPGERLKLTNSEDKTKNIGLRMIFGMVKDISYQNMLGLNVLTMKI